MLSTVVARLRPIADGLVRGDWLGPLAAGFALGLAVTLTPAGHLISVSLCVLLFSLRVKHEEDRTSPADSLPALAAPPEESFSCVA